MIFKKKDLIDLVTYYFHISATIFRLVLIDVIARLVVVKRGYTCFTNTGQSLHQLYLTDSWDLRAYRATP